MAYSYNDFLNAANSSGTMNRFSQEDLTVAQKNPEYGLSMVSLLKDLDGATTAEQRLLATEAANQLRKNYGVYGTGGTYAGSFGSQISDLMGKLNNYGSFNYGNESVYQQMLNAVTNPEEFQYDQSSDPAFSALKKAYLREGERAGANALAQAAAASGGQVSSYATQAAQQANNYYAGQLADMIPQLEQNAYQRYLSDFQSKLSGLSALQSDRAQAQENWMNGYNVLQNNLQNLQQQDATDYQRYLQQVEQALAQQQYADQQAQQKYENALALYNLLGYATPEVAQILGLNSGIVNAGADAGIQNGVVTGGETNTNLSREQIMELQRLLGLPEDGVWGDVSAATAKAMWGSTSVDDAWNHYMGMNSGTSNVAMSDTAKRFMATLPYAYGGADQATWNKVVDERLNAAYSNGTLSESDVVAIMTQLGLYDVESEEEQPAAKPSAGTKPNTQNKTTQTSKKPVTVRAPGSAAAVNNRFNSVY